MKKQTKYMLILILLGLSVPVFSQIIGVRAGLNLSTQYATVGPDIISDKYNYESIAGWHTGLSYEQEISSVFSLESGVYYTTKGFTSKSRSTDGINQRTEADSELHYIEFPVVLKTYISINRDIKLFLNAGPYIGIGLSGKVLIKTYNTQTSEGNNTLSEIILADEDIKWGDGPNDDVRKGDLGASIGAGLQVNNVEVRLIYRHTLNNLNSYNHDNELQNRVFMFSLGYLFRL